MTTKYRPQYRDPHSQMTSWYSAGLDVFEKEAKKMVLAKLHEYTGTSPTKRFLRITEEVVEIVPTTTIEFKETI